MYSAFSERSPWAAAAATAWQTLGRSSRQRSSSSRRRRRAPSGVMYFEPAGATCRKRLIGTKSCELCRTYFYRNRGFCGTSHGRPPRGATNLQTVATKYYTHFVTASSKAQSPGCGSEWSGVVELRALLAHSFDLDSEDIRILHWARLH